MADHPCACWVDRVALHSDHCCFGDGWDGHSDTLDCGHEQAGRAAREARDA